MLQRTNLTKVAKIFSVCCLSLFMSAEFVAADEHQALALSLFKELIETDTTHSTGDTGIAAEKMAKHLLAAGFPEEDVHVIKNAERKGNLVVRLRGVTDKQGPKKGPILLLAHIDVVEANPEDWNLDPFKFIVQGDHYYGRGTLDDKDEAAIHVANLIRMKREGYQPNRDIIVALTADEEGGPNNGVQYLLKHHFDLVNADFVINEGGGGVIKDGVHAINAIQAAEKVYQSYRLEVTNAGGHSSRPRADNAIYELAHALTKIQGHEFPVALNETTRAFFMASQSVQTPEDAQHIKGLLEAKPSDKSIVHFAQQANFNALLRTTCVATQLEAGHAENALPQRATATVNCRILPGHDPEGIWQTLVDVIDDGSISVTPIKAAIASDPSPLTDEIMTAVKEETHKLWPKAIVIPSMSTGATDGLYFRNVGIPVYGVSGIFREAGENRAHGRDERILKIAFEEGLVFLDRLVRRLTSD